MFKFNLHLAVPSRRSPRDFPYKTCTYFLFLLFLLSVVSISCSGGCIHVVPWKRQTDRSSRYWRRPVVSIDRWYTVHGVKELNSLRFTFIRRRNCPPAGKVGVPSRPVLRINLPGQPTSRLSLGWVIFGLLNFVHSAFISIDSNPPLTYYSFIP